ncbi:biotin/lipoyl-binding protein, partial [Pseudomonas helleri]
MAISAPLKKKLLVAATGIAILALGWYAWVQFRDDGLGEAFASGNGRIEATEIDIATKLAGRVTGISVQEGDFVTVGQSLATMQIDVLQAQLAEATAGHQE